MSQLMDGTASQFERLPPHSLDGERCLLASMMLDKEIIGQVVQILDKDAFFQADHQIIYDVVIKLYEQNRPIDAVIIREELSRRQQLDEIGGLPYLVQILNSVPSAAHGAQYAEIVRDKHLLRQLIYASNATLRECYAPTDQPAENVVDEAEKRIFEIAQKRVSGNITPLETVLHSVFEMIENRSQRGLETGFYDLDDILNGLQNGEMIIVAARPSMGKCLAADSEIVLDDGSIATIEEICRRRDGRILTLDDQTLRFTQTTPSAFIDDGIKPVFRVTTALGRTVTTTLTHPFRTIDGWKPLGDLEPGAWIAAPRRIDVFGTQPLPDARAKLLGYLLGDGGLTDTIPEFTNNNPTIQADFLASLADFGGVTAKRNIQSDRATSYSVRGDAAALASNRAAFSANLQTTLNSHARTARSVAQALDVSPSLLWQWLHGKSIPDDQTLAELGQLLGIDAASLVPSGPRRKNAPNALTRWLDDLGLRGADSHAKFIPSCVFTADRRTLALFLNRLFATDGWATVLSSGQSQLGYATVSERMARQIQHLLLRFGIIASLRHKRVRYRDERRTCWQLNITDRASIETFIGDIGMHGKEDHLARVRIALRGRRHQTNRDLIPPQIWKEIERSKGAMSWAEMSRLMGLRPGANMHVGRRAPTRPRLAAMARALNSPQLAALADSDLFWDRIVSIELVGRQQVYDLTVPATHNFVANDICVHNTALAMNLIEGIAAPPGRQGMPCAVFSLEMSKQQLAQRLLCSRGKVDSHKLRRGQLSAADYQHLANVVGELAKAPIWVDDSAGLTPLELRAKARRLKTQYDIRCIMLDYMQLMDNPGPDSRQQQISEISRAIKAVAREINVPVIALSQLNRATEGRDGHRPRMSDLRESGSIEQDADVVMLLHREDYYRQSEPDFQPDNVAELIVAKQRNGPTGTVKLFFDNKSTRFDNLAAQGDPYASV